MSGRHRYPNRGLALRRVLLSSAPQDHGKLVDKCWGAGESRESDPHWLRLPKMLSPEGAFKYVGFAIRVTRQRALVVGWITERRALDEALREQIA